MLAKINALNLRTKKAKWAGKGIAHQSGGANQGGGSCGSVAGNAGSCGGISKGAC